MATTNYQSAKIFETNYPNTNKPLEKFIVALAKCAKNRGKVSITGKDKGQAAFVDLMASTDKLMVAMAQDYVIEFDASANEIREKIVALVEEFSAIYPNWQDAYSTCTQIFIHEKDDCNEMIEHMIKGT